MNGKRPLVSPPPEADGPYRYYLIADFRPVRITCDERGRKIYAEATNREGVLEFANLVGTIEKDEDVDEISKGEFVERCHADVSPAAYPKRPYVPPPPDADGPYEYYRHYGQPVRIYFNRHGRAVAAETPSWKHGALEVQHVSLYPKDRASSLPITKTGSWSYASRPPLTSRGAMKTLASRHQRMRTVLTNTACLACGRCV
jgi:hypothetical protein